MSEGIFWLEGHSVHDPRGDLTIYQCSPSEIPFVIKRVYLLHNVPGGSLRGGHAHRTLSQAFISVNGSATITIWDGNSEEVFELNDPTKALVIPNGLWREMGNFANDAKILVLASELYSEADYIRDKFTYSEWLNVKP